MCWLPVKQERKLKQFRLPLDLLERLNMLRKARGYDSLNEVVEYLLYKACEKAEEQQGDTVKRS